jgi:hypothetical protein
MAPSGGHYDADRRKAQVVTQAYPLQWPDGWPRHKGAQDSDRRFRGPTFNLDRVYHGLKEELRRIGATQIVVSTNQPFRQDGAPYAQQRSISDVGVAVYFMRDGRSLVMAQDRFWSIIGNMRSLTMAIEGLRQMERHGGAAMMERAFTGFLAIAPPDWKKPWREAMGLKPDWAGSARDIKRRYHELAKVRHPDNGGSDELMGQLNVAFAEACAEMGARP